MRYGKVAVGGTFDHLHDGHKALLSKAFEIGESPLIGITSDRMVRERYADDIQTLKHRKKNLKDFLRKHGWLERADLTTISDFTGPVADDGEFEAIVVSEETRPKDRNNK